MTDQSQKVFTNTYYYLTQGLSGTECYISPSDNSMTKLRQIGITRITPHKGCSPGAAADYKYKLIIPTRHRKVFVSVITQLGYIRDLRGWKDNVPDYLYGAYFDDDGVLRHNCFGCEECDGHGNLKTNMVERIMKMCQQPHIKEGNTVRLISLPKNIDEADSKNVNDRKKSKGVGHDYDSDEMEDWVAANIQSRVIKNGVIKCDGCKTQITDGYWKIENNEEYFEDDGIDYYRVCNRCTRNEGTWVSLK